MGDNKIIGTKTVAKTKSKKDITKDNAIENNKRIKSKSKKVIKVDKDFVEDDNDDIKEQLYIIQLHGLEKFRAIKAGKIWSDKDKKFVKTQIVNGYHILKIPTGNFTVHRIIAQTFIPQPEDKPYVNHIDENKVNNCVENLEWVTQKENTERHSKVTSHSRQVNQIDPKTNELIETYNMITDAAKAVDVTRRAIQHVLSGKNPTAGGYYWEYVNVNNYHDILDEGELDNAIQVKDCKNYYVFSDSKVFNSLNKRFLTPCVNAAGRSYVTLCNNGKKKNYYLANLVANYYLPDKPNENARVRHISSDLTDNRVENLQWIVPKRKVKIDKQETHDESDDVVEISDKSNSSKNKKLVKTTSKTKKINKQKETNVVKVKKNNL